MPEAWEDREPVLPVCRSAAFGGAAVENRYRKELRNNYADPLLLFFFLSLYGLHPHCYPALYSNGSVHPGKNRLQHHIPCKIRKMELLQGYSLDTPYDFFHAFFGWNRYVHVYTIRQRCCLYDSDSSHLAYFADGFAYLFP